MRRWIFPFNLTLRRNDEYLPLGIVGACEGMGAAVFGGRSSLPGRLRANEPPADTARQSQGQERGPRADSSGRSHRLPHWIHETSFTHGCLCHQNRQNQEALYAKVRRQSSDPRMPALDGADVMPSGRHDSQHRKKGRLPRPCGGIAPPAVTGLILAKSDRFVLSPLWRANFS